MKIDLTDPDVRRRMKGLRDGYIAAMERTVALANDADIEGAGIVALEVATKVFGPRAIHQAATRYRVSVNARLAHVLRGLADGFQKNAEDLNGLLADPADFSQGIEDLDAELIGGGTRREIAALERE